ncbi:unnamed protein product [Echinostoma caproni]|uniref:Uncharacterized protein n=1 Tax=Echinostoma caproni TaxID=27848 RepID=A0A183B4N9_9TREM|nr:unnamed protein product [Echinostoma caproni]
MISAGYIATTELSKTKEYTSETIICLYSINLTRIANLLIELSQHSALRIAIRAKHEFEQKNACVVWFSFGDVFVRLVHKCINRLCYRRLIEQRYRVETLIEKHQSKLAVLEKTTVEGSGDDNTDDADLVTQHKESLESLKSSITPAEQKQLIHLTSRLAKLASSEQETHITWFVSELYLRLHE